MITFLNVSVVLLIGGQVTSVDQNRENTKMTSEFNQRAEDKMGGEMDHHQKHDQLDMVDSSKANFPIMEVACGECMFGLPGDGCDLAVRFEGEAYFVEGIGIDDLGDAHADDGMCNAIRKAKVQGELLDGIFHVLELELLP